MSFSEEVARFTIRNAAQHQVELIYLTEMLRDNFASSLPKLANKKLVGSYNILKTNFNSDEEFKEYVDDEMQKALYSFDKAMWSSLFTYSYFNLEKDLADLCKKIEQEIESKITLGNLNGNGIIRSKLFLKKLAQVDFEEFNEDWEYIINCMEIRNCISHNGGSINKSNRKDETSKFCDQNDGISLDDSILSISPRFVVGTCDRFYNFWLGISNQLIPENPKWAKTV